MSLDSNVNPVAAAREMFRAWKRGRVTGEELLRTIIVTRREKEILRKSYGETGKSQAEEHLRHRKAVREAFLLMIENSRHRRVRTSRSAGRWSSPRIPLDG